MMVPVSAKTTVLVADDDEGVLRFVCSLLERDGHKVIRARDGSEALALARKHGQDVRVLLTDVRMPGLDGRQLAEAVVRMNPDIRVVYMTGFAEEEFKRGSVALRKPFRPEALKAVVTRSAARSAGSGGRPRGRPAAGARGGSYN